MEVILVKPVRKLGAIGEIVPVAGGFARNYLFPRGLAIRATELNKSVTEQRKQDFEEKDKAVRSEVEKINSLIQGRELVFLKQSADDGRLFGSVSNKEIAKDLSSLVSHDIPPSSILLNKQIKSLGLSTVDVRLHPELSASIVVVVARSESEAQNYIRDHKEEKSEGPAS